jgi:predicted DNA-binding transcriptional regulator YafY
VYDRVKKGFVLTGGSSPLMSNGEILAVSKILLESRAFTRGEMSDILDKLISGCVPEKNLKLVTDLISNEKFHYVELTHPAGIQDKLWEIGSSIQQHDLLELAYQRQGEDAPALTRIVEPVAILFSEYYFYLNAYIVTKNEAGHYVHRFDYPAIFRVDRIQRYTVLPEKFHLPYADRFQEGEFRKRVQFMYPGQLQQIRFRYSGTSVEAVLDRLPTARVLSQDEGGAVIQAEVYGKGILMWLMSQGPQVEVLAPQQLRQEMELLLVKTLERYDDETDGSND